jgi:hypothetical protein
VLEEIHELRDSITAEQRGKIENKLPKNILDRLDSAFDSSDQEEAEERVALFAVSMKKKPLKALALYRIMGKRQREIVLGLMGDDDE